MTETNVSSATAAAKRRMTARALLLGERIDVAGLERSDVISTTPLAFRAGHGGYAVVFRFGAIVLIGLSVVEEDELIRGLKPRIVAPFARPEDESVTIEIAPTATIRSRPVARSRCAISRRRDCWSSPMCSPRTSHCRATNARSARSSK